MTKLEKELCDALQAARIQLVALGGDSSGLVTKDEAEECSVDMIQWEILRMIDVALSHC